MDEPQKMEGAATQAALKKFNPMFVLNYSATHRTKLNAIENAKIDCCTQLFNEISTDNVKYHKVTCYQDLIDAMTSAK